MTKTKRNLIPFRNLNENQKDDILNYIKDTELSIKKAALDLEIGVDTINRIFAERYGKKDKEGQSEIKSRKKYFKEYWKKNKFK